jgi:RNA polymerase primary sigma factor
MITTDFHRDPTLNVLKPIEFIASSEFETQATELTSDVALLLADIESKRLRSEPIDHMYAHGLGDLPVLSRDEEQRCFRAMNFLKYQIDQLQRATQRNCLSGNRLQESVRMQADVRTIRDYLIYSNLRLVISLVKKYVGPQFSFDELYSEGIVTLMQAVEKFNYLKGFRFSTYAYRSISRSLYHLLVDSQQDSTLYVNDDEQLVDSVAQPDRSSTVGETWWQVKRDQLSKLVQRLDRREQLIVRARYALTPRGTIKTFQALANKLGISKERVRQLEQRAIQKLQTMAGEIELG